MDIWIEQISIAALLVHVYYKAKGHFAHLDVSKYSIDNACFCYINCYRFFVFGLNLNFTLYL